MLAKVAIIEDSILLYCETYVHFKVGHMATLTQKIGDSKGWKIK